MDLGLADRSAGIAGAARGPGAGSARLRAAAVSSGAVASGRRAGELAKPHRAKPVTVDRGASRAHA
jgi:hypothetical protein